MGFNKTSSISDGYTSFLMDKYRDKVLEPHYLEYISDFTKNLTMYNGKILPSDKILHYILCRSMISPIVATAHMIKSIINENLDNNSSKFLVVFKSYILEDKDRLLGMLDNNLKKYVDVANSDNNLKKNNSKNNKNNNKIDNTDTNYTSVFFIDNLKLTDTNSYTDSYSDSKQILSVIKKYMLQSINKNNNNNNNNNKNSKTPLIIVSENKYSVEDMNLILKTTEKENIIEYGEKSLNNNLGNDVDRNRNRINYDLKFYISKNSKNIIHVLNSIQKFYGMSSYKILCVVDNNIRNMKNLQNTVMEGNLLHYKMMTHTYIQNSEEKNYSSFINVNNMFYEKILLGKKYPVKSKVGENAQNAILFITTDELLKLNNCNNILGLQGINVVILMNKSGLDKNTKTVINNIVDSNLLKTDRSYYKTVVVDFDRNADINFNISHKLCDINDTFYNLSKNNELDNKNSNNTNSNNTNSNNTNSNNTNSNNTNSNNNTEKNETLSPKLTSYIYLRNLISENVIRLDTKLNKAKIQKIEKIYLIKQIDKDYMNRHNIAHIVQMVKNIDTMCSFNMYQIEKSYLNIDKNRLEEHIQVLKDECREILTNNKNKNKYSGPLWLGRSNGRELEGSMVCFLHDNKRDLVEYAMILGVTGFSRKYKRVGWTEKENKDKKILFLSPIIKKEKLSVFRKKRNIPSYKKFSTMEPITL